MQFKVSADLIGKVMTVSSSNGHHFDFYLRVFPGEPMMQPLGIPRWNGNRQPANASMILQAAEAAARVEARRRGWI